MQGKELEHSGELGNVWGVGIQQGEKPRACVCVRVCVVYSGKVEQRKAFKMGHSYAKKKASSKRDRQRSRCTLRSKSHQSPRTFKVIIGTDLNHDISC